MTQPIRSDGAGQARPRVAAAPQQPFERGPRPAERARRAEIFTEPGPIDLRAPPNALAASLSTWRAGRNADTGPSTRTYDRWSEPVANDAGRRPLRRAGKGLAAIGRAILSGAAALAIVGAAVGIVYAWTALRAPGPVAATPTEKPVAAAAASATTAKPAPATRSIVVKPQPSTTTKPRAAAPAIAAPAPAIAPVAPGDPVPDTANPRWAAAPDAEPARRIFEAPPSAGEKPLAFAAPEPQVAEAPVGEPADPSLPLPQARPTIEQAPPPAKAEQAAALAPARDAARPEPAQPQAAEPAPPRATEPAQPRAAATGGSRRTVSRSVNLRAAPANGSRILGTIRAGAPVQVLSCKFWCEVVSDGRRGFIFRSFLSGEARGASAGVSNERTASTGRSQQRRAEKPKADKPDAVFVPDNSR